VFNFFAPVGFVVKDDIAATAPHVGTDASESHGGRYELLVVSFPSIQGKLRGCCIPDFDNKARDTPLVSTHPHPLRAVQSSQRRTLISSWHEACDLR